jgi:phosphoribosylformimino-5-aminoimidazole carboxamide ribotide isomerase
VDGWIGQYGEKLVAGVDADKGQIRVSGWEEGAGLQDLEFVRRLSQKGMTRLIYTAISQDGTLEGPDLERTPRVAGAFGAPTILSGGIGSDGDVGSVFALQDPRIAGVISGTAVYEGLVDLRVCIQRYQTDHEIW